MFSGCLSICACDLLPTSSLMSSISVVCGALIVDFTFGRCSFEL